MHKNFRKPGIWIILSLFVAHCGQSKQGDFIMLSQTPTDVTIVHEMAFEFGENITNAFNKLSREERVMTYFLQKAGSACVPIYIDHIHRHGLQIIALFNKLAKNLALASQDTIKLPVSLEQFKKDVTDYQLYLLANHGQYFQREHGNEKRTPHKIGLSSLNEKNLISVLEQLDMQEEINFVKNNSKIIFDAATEPTLNVPGNIEQSAINFYAPNFTEQDYLAIPATKKGNINTYFDVIIEGEKRTPVVIPFSTQARYAKELTEACAWLNKALILAQKYPTIFDAHFAKSLELLIKYFTTGDEQLFKEHSIEWLKTKSQLDYNFGFIECYHDPKGIRSSFQAEVTVKTLDISKLNALLPEIEAALPFPSEFKRDGVEAGTATIPNASINVKLFGTGGLGPVSSTAAYCLPNYEEIRASHGSKQIIYPSGKGLGQRLNPDKARKLFNLKDKVDWLLKNDPDGKLSNDIWDVQCILHETIGHASGKLATHTFRQGDILTIEGKTYTEGTSIPVTNKNLSEFLSGYESTLEELRAEIIALYVSIEHIDTLLNAGFLSQWLSCMTKEELIDRLILGMAKTGLNRLMQLSDSATEVTGAHAQANYTIMNYLIDHGGLAIAEESLELDGKQFTVLGLTIKDRNKTKELIKELMLEVQQIKSSGDSQGVAKLIDTYGKKIRHSKHPQFLRECREHLVGKVKASVTIYPVFKPVVDAMGNVIDCNAEWPKNFLSGYKETYPQILQS